MKLDPVVKRETAFIAMSSLFCAALIQGGFFLFGKWDLSVLWGGVIGWVLTVGNFFLMSLDVQKAVESDDPQKAQMKMRASYTWRMMAMLAVMVVSFVVDGIHWLPVVASVFYPRIVITVRQLWQKFVLKIPEEVPETASAPAEWDEEEEEDGFEKALGQFAKKINTDYSSAKPDAETTKDEKKGDT